MRHWHFEVRPRFTPGSPACVDERTAERVAAQEKRGFEMAREGVYGAEEKRFADVVGNAWIVFCWQETGRATKPRFNVQDLLTGIELKAVDHLPPRIQAGRTFGVPPVIEGGKAEPGAFVEVTFGRHSGARGRIDAYDDVYAGFVRVTFSTPGTSPAIVPVEFLRRIA